MDGLPWSRGVCLTGAKLSLTRTHGDAWLISVIQCLFVKVHERISNELDIEHSVSMCDVHWNNDCIAVFNHTTVDRWLCRVLFAGHIGGQQQRMNDASAKCIEILILLRPCTQLNCLPLTILKHFCRMSLQAKFCAQISLQ